MSPLNWKEVALLAPQLDQKLRGEFVDQVVIPERRRFAEGFIKAEWALRLGRGCLIFSVRPRMPYFEWVAGKGPASSKTATHSPFDLALAKRIRGAKIMAVQALERERALEIQFAGKLSLLIVLIPATPEAVLLDRESGSPIARSRTLPLQGFKLPDGSRAPQELECRELSLEQYSREIQKALDTEAFGLRKTKIEKLARESRKKWTERLRQSEKSAQEAASEPDWQRYGELLKATLPDAPKLVRGIRLVTDYEIGKTVEVPCDPKLNATDQVSKYFSLARRRASRANEAAMRITAAKDSLTALESISTLRVGDWTALENAETALGISAPASGTQKSQKSSVWPGRAFKSIDGWAIWVGRTKDENLELTFKCARGNDLWMHVRGKPGAHVIVPVQPGKSAPLETLLDAAQLAIHYSGGENWGTTEVDYAFKKFVKRIRDSTEASYTSNKTLLIKPDPTRVKRLLGLAT